MTVITDSFEKGFYLWHGEGEMTVPNEWHPDWEQGEERKRPEFKPDPTPEHVHHGSVSAKMAHRHVKFDGFLYRTFSDILAGGRVDVEVFFKAFSDPKGGLAGRVGIDPTGGIDFSSPEVVWGDFWGQYQDDWSNETWHKLTVSSLARAARITVFLEARQDWGVNVTAAHWDSFTMVAAGGEQPPPGGSDLEAIRAIVREENGYLFEGIRVVMAEALRAASDVFAD